MKINVENMAYECSEEDLRLAFAQFGQVKSATITRKKDNGQIKRVGLVGMTSSDEGQAAIDGLNGKELNGKVLSVAEVFRPGKKRGGGAGYGGGKDIYDGGRGVTGGARSVYASGKGGKGGGRAGQGRGR